MAAVIHDVFANLLVGRSVFDIESHWSNMFATVNFFGFAGAEMRAISTVEVALWDLLGQYTGQPIYNLLGGRSRDRIPIYNTCVSHGPHMDYHAWMEGRAGELAQELLATGVRGMKIWPWDQFGVSLGGPVGQVGARLHCAQHGLVEEMVGFVDRGQVKRYIIGLCEEILKTRHLDA